MDNHNAIRIYMDGDQWCAVREPFTNLQECNAGFDSDPAFALEALLREEDHGRKSIYARGYNDGIDAVCGSSDAKI